MDRPANPTPADAAPPREGWPLRLLVASLFALASVSALSQNLVDPDLWGHVLYGEEVIMEGRLPKTATHTFTAVDYPWVNHENLAELALAACFRNFGVTGLLVAKCLLGVAVLGMMHHAARRHGVPRLIAWTLFLLLAVILKTYFYLRPQLLSFAYCGVMLLMFLHAFRDWRGGDQGRDDAPRCVVRWGWLLPAPLLMVLWVNSHGGFLAGCCILGAVFVGRSVEALLVDGRRALRTVAGLAAIGLGCAGSLFVNPYGTGLLLWLRESLGSPRPEISEWLPPGFDDPVFVPFVSLVLVNLVAWSATNRRRDWTQAAVLVLVGWQAFEHLRHIAFFALLSGFWTPPHLAATIARLRHATRRWTQPTFSVAMRATLCVLLLPAIVWQTSRIADRLTKLPVSNGAYPIEAFDFMAQHGVGGRIVTPYNWAQYTLAAFPESTVAFDGRFRTCYPQEVVDMHFDFLAGNNYRFVSPFNVHELESFKQVFGDQEFVERPMFPIRNHRHRSPDSGPVDPRRVLEHGDPEIVLVDRKYKHGAVRVMREESEKDDGEWTLLYQDSVAQVWGRRRVFDDPASDRYLPPSERHQADTTRRFAVQWPAMPLRDPAAPPPDEAPSPGGDPSTGGTPSHTAARSAEPATPPGA